MKEKELIDLIEAYGSDTERWPEDKREDALLLLDKSERAQAMLKQAIMLDQLLDDYGTDPAREDYINKVVEENTFTTAGGTTGFHLNSPLLAYAAGIVICLLAGYLLGYADSLNVDHQINQLESVLFFRNVY